MLFSAFSPFPTRFSTISRTNPNARSIFSMLSANNFKYDQSKLLSLHKVFEIKQEFEPETGIVTVF